MGMHRYFNDDYSGRYDEPVSAQVYIKLRNELAARLIPVKKGDDGKLYAANIYTSAPSWIGNKDIAELTKLVGEKYEVIIGGSE